MSTLNANSYTELQYFIPRVLFGGSEWGEFNSVSQTISSSIKQNSGLFWQQWFEGWHSHGSILFEEARNVSPQAAKNIYMRAAAAYHWAEFMYFQDLPSKEACRKMVTESFHLALAQSPNTGEKIVIPYREHLLPGYYFRASENENHPTVILINGLDSAKEVELYQFTRYFLKEGINCIVFDGPGQGELMATTSMDTNFEAVVAAVIEKASELPGVESSKLGVFGVSFGGYLAMRSFALNKKLKACINLSGAFDLDNYSQINARVQHDFRYVFKVPDDNEMKRIAKTEVTLAETTRPDGKILTIHGGKDAVFPPENCRKIKDWCGVEQVEEILYDKEAHVCQNYIYHYMPRAAAWLAAELDH